MTEIGPYFNITLTTTTLLRSNQMDNNIYKHLKTNIEKKLLGKCYNSYGFVSKIYKITDYECIGMPAEDPTCSAQFKITFTCKLCRPLINGIIIMTVSDINKDIINLTYGPMVMLTNVNMEYKINNPAINMDNFIFDEKKNLILAKDKKDKTGKVGTPIDKKTNLQVKVQDIQIEKDSTKIIIFGYIEDIASDDDFIKMIETSESDKTKETKISTIDKLDKEGKAKLLEESTDYLSEDEFESDEESDIETELDTESDS